MKNTSTHALTAKAIKQELKKLFPSTKFSVKSDSFAGGNSVDVSWDNGPRRKQVDEIISKYQYGHFNGMEDIYEISNRNENIPQVRFVHSSRNINEEIIEEIFAYLQKNYVHFDKVTIDETSDLINKYWDCWNARTYIYRVLSKMDLSNGFKPELL